ncbi:NlpC/P60 family protein [Nocardia asteroides]|uniref:C40 family peptidase n=1 Tax=Nocardia asteroides TaxID=1824 RepID=UPI0037CBB404
MTDPAAIIAVIAIATSDAANSSQTPEQLRPVATAVGDAIQEFAPTIIPMIDQGIAQLPDPIQEPVQQAVDEALGTPSTTLHTDESAPRTEPGGSPPTPVVTAPGDVTIDEAPRDGFGEVAPETMVAPAARAPSPPMSGTLAVFTPWLRKAGELCQGVNSATLAGIYSVENGFRFGAGAPVSPAGALGPGQFMPATWRQYGRDADGDGTADVLGVADSVMASGQLMCDMYAQIQQWKDEGRVVGDSLDLTVAAYNAGAGAVLRSGGMPSGSPDYETQTKPYVGKVKAAAEQLAPLLAAPTPVHVPALAEGVIGASRRAVDEALSFLGTPYVWGGGNANGPTSGGFDCSGLTQYAVAAATNGSVLLPRTSQQQWLIGHEVPLDQAQPGDLLFGNWGSDGPGHVALYLGDGTMIHAPTTGDVVRVGPVMDAMVARRVL